MSIDTGAYRSGILTSAVFDRDGLRFLQAVGAPDRAAIVRELLLSVLIHGGTLSLEADAASEEFLAGRIEMDEFECRTRRAAR